MFCLCWENDVEPQELGHRSVLLPRFVVLLLFSVLPLSLKDLTEF